MVFVGRSWQSMGLHKICTNEPFYQNLLECVVEMLPLVVGGDFNIIHYPSEKSNDRFNSRWPNLFELPCLVGNLLGLVM
jgi:hypothetical protein